MDKVSKAIYEALGQILNAGFTSFECKPNSLDVLIGKTADNHNVWLGINKDYNRENTLWVSVSYHTGCLDDYDEPEMEEVWDFFKGCSVGNDDFGHGNMLSVHVDDLAKVVSFALRPVSYELRNACPNHPRGFMDMQMFAIR